MLGRDARGLLAVALAAAVFSMTLLGGRARAEDAVGEPAKPSPTAPAAPPTPRAKIAHPYLDSLVGSWDLTMKIPGQPDQKGHARWWKALDGTALVEELVADQGAEPFFGYGVLYVGADGKTASRWWFDSMGQDRVWATKGALAEDGWTLKDEGSEHVMKKTKDGHAYTMKMGAKVAVEVAYRKSAAEHPAAPVVEALAIQHPFVKASVGEYAVKSVFQMGSMSMPTEAKATIRLGVGGCYSIEDYDSSHPGGRTVGIGVASVADGGKTMHEWWFTNFEDGPVVLAGDLTDTAFHGRGSGPSGAMEAEWSKTATGYQMKATLANGATMTETYTRLK